MSINPFVPSVPKSGIAKVGLQNTQALMGYTKNRISKFLRLAQRYDDFKLNPLVPKFFCNFS